MTNPRDIRQRQLGAISASLLLHGGMAIAVSVAPNTFTSRPKELADAVYIESVGEGGMPQGDQIEALPAAGAATDSVAQKSEAPQAGDAKPVAKEAAPEPVTPPATAAPSDVVVAPLPEKKPIEKKQAAKPEPKKSAVTPTKAMLPKKTVPAPEPEMANTATSQEPASVEQTPEAIETLEQDSAEFEEEEPLEQPAEVAAVPVVEEPVPAPPPVQSPTALPPSQQAAGRINPAPQALSAATHSGVGHYQGPGGQGANQSYGIRDAAELKGAPGNRPPNYPERDRLMRNQGTVVFLARVQNDGSVTDIRIEKSTQSRSLDMAALEAMKKWRFLPGQEGVVRKGFTFSLDGETEELPARLRR